MRLEDESLRLGSGKGEPGLVARVLAFSAGTAFVVAGVLFSVLLVTVVAVLGLSALTYFWWKTRGLRRQVREQQGGGRVLEGEVIRNSPS
jgi:Flp pilus assembly protein TadB